MTDSDQIKEKGISQAQLEEQLSRFKTGFRSLQISRPATLNDGILPLTDKTILQYSTIYGKEIAGNMIPLKFVPASGAATRMFKALFQYLDSSKDEGSLDNDDPISIFIHHLPSFAFYELLKGHLPHLDIDDISIRKAHSREIISTLLKEQGLNYGSLPKGLLLFHRYTKDARTPMLEHMHEGADYAKSSNNEVNLHFTVSSEHQSLFEAERERHLTQVEKESGARFRITFSSQKPHTDTVAVLSNNEPYRDSQGHLLFRPGGHGSLIENLNDQDADIIFIKNIDNVVPAHHLEETSKYKKALGGIAFSLRNAVHQYIRKMNDNLTRELVQEIRQFMKETFYTDIPDSIDGSSYEEQGQYFREFLDRPIRVCGMVRNEGDPGGGPFWVKDKKGQSTLQIVESSQIDMNNSNQKKIFGASTHFNPVDLVCITKDYEGRKFDLTRYIDVETGFISEKSVSGKNIKALERPGLWNGAMANWLTLFVEVPGETFNPTKTVNDLLGPGHQGI